MTRSIRTTNRRARNHWRKAVRREWRAGVDNFAKAIRRVGRQLDEICGRYEKAVILSEEMRIFRHTGKHPALGMPYDSARYRK